MRLGSKWPSTTWRRPLTRGISVPVSGADGAQLLVIFLRGAAPVGSDGPHHALRPAGGFQGHAAQGLGGPRWQRGAALRAVLPSQGLFPELLPQAPELQQLPLGPSHARGLPAAEQQEPRAEDPAARQGPQGIESGATGRGAHETLRRRPGAGGGADHLHRLGRAEAHGAARL